MKTEKIFCADFIRNRGRLVFVQRGRGPADKIFYGTMPLRDAGEYPFEIFLSYVRHALWLRKTIDWCKKLPEDLFVHDVLYYRINSEDISDCRSFFTSS